MFDKQLHIPCHHHRGSFGDLNWQDEESVFLTQKKKKTTKDIEVKKCEQQQQQQQRRLQIVQKICFAIKRGVRRFFVLSHFLSLSLSLSL